MKLSAPLPEMRAAWRSLDLVIGDGYERSRVRFEPLDGAVAISATDLEQLLTIEIPARIDDATPVVVPGATLGAFLREQEGDEITLETNASRLVVLSPTDEFRTALYDEALWPRSDHLSGPKTIWPEDQIAAIDRVTWCAARDDARPLLKGIQLQDTMAVAMDSFGMAAVRTPMSATTKVIVPARTLEIAAKLPVGAEGYSFASDASRATFASGGWQLTTTLIQGTFPEWKALVSDPCPPRIVCHRSDLASALRRVRALAKRDVLRTVVFRPDPSGSGIVLHVSVPDVGEQTAHTPGSCELEGIGLNFERVLNAIDNLPTDEVRIEITANGYAVIRDDDYIAVVPPVKGAH